MKAKKRDKAVSDSEHEQARTALLLGGLPNDVLSVMSIRQIRQLYRLRLSHGTVWHIRQTIIDSREGIIMEGSTRTSRAKTKSNPAISSSKKATDEEVGAQVVLERVARIVTKTYPHLGDDELVASEDALRMIYRELGHFDPSILKRNEKRALPKQTPLTNLSARS